LALLWFANCALAKDVTVDLELVLAVDVSLSMDIDEQRLQRDGYAAAFRHRDVIDAIKLGGWGKIVVTYVEWAGQGLQRVVLPWTVIDGALATGNATVTMAVGGVGVTGGVVTITQSGSAADDVAFAVPSAANDCDAREVITGTVGGTSTTGAGTLLVHFAPRAA